MPHAIIEYTANLAETLNPALLVAKAHEVMGDSGLFAPAAIKSRAYKTEHFLVGDKGEKGSFVHITIALLEGRTIEQRSALTQTMFDAFRAELPEEISLSVDIQDMMKETYRK